MSNSRGDGGQPSYVTGSGYLLAALGSEAERSWSATIRRAGLTQVEFSVLTVLCEHDGLSQREVARRIGQDARNVVATVARLGTRSLVSSAVDDRDRRRKVLAVTTAGRRVMADVGRELRAERSSFLAPLDEDEQEQLRSLLERVHRHRLGD